ncbi:unnamed protein product [Lepidochelys kempii]
MEKVLKESILKHLEERKVIRNRQHGFTKGSLDPSEGSSSPAVLCYPKEKTPVSQAARNVWGPVQRCEAQVKCLEFLQTLWLDEFSTLTWVYCNYSAIVNYLPCT